jgi:2-iminobutanoate/2-iminopropanoate deaminase
MKKETVATKKAPVAVGPYSQAIRTGHFVFTAGQVALDPASGKLVDGGITAQTNQALENIKAVLAAAGTDLEHVIKTTVFLQDMAHFSEMNAAYANHFVIDPPARSTVEVAKLPLGALVEIETIAVLP